LLSFGRRSGCWFNHSTNWSCASRTGKAATVKK
jgi:hypothetical protein